MCLSEILNTYFCTIFYLWHYVNAQPHIQLWRTKCDLDIEGPWLRSNCKCTKIRVSRKLLLVHVES